MKTVADSNLKELHLCLFGRSGEECGRFKFECANIKNPMADPQCIAVYDRCDGTVQCSDGSDEMDCDGKLLFKSN